MTDITAMLFEAVVCCIDCAFCHRGFSTRNQHETTAIAIREGWRVTRQNNVMCPTCSAKRKRKSSPKKKSRV